jgi:hypothetical protein
MSKPFLLRDKTDALDAQAIWVAAQHPFAVFDFANLICSRVEKAAVHQSLPV